MADSGSDLERTIRRVQDSRSVEALARRTARALTVIRRQLADIKLMMLGDQNLLEAWRARNAQSMWGEVGGRRAP